MINEYIKVNKMVMDSVLNIQEYLELRGIKETADSVDELTKVVNKNDTPEHCYMTFPLENVEEMVQYIKETNARMCLVYVPSQGCATWFEY